MCVFLACFCCSPGGAVVEFRTTLAYENNHSKKKLLWSTVYLHLAAVRSSAPRDYISAERWSTGRRESACFFKWRQQDLVDAYWTSLAMTSRSTLRWRPRCGRSKGCWLRAAAANLSARTTKPHKIFGYPINTTTEVKRSTEQFHIRNLFRI